MKRYTLYTFPALALLLAAAACTQDDAVLLPEAPEGIPMTFTAKGLNPTAATTTGTRATVDGDWKGVTAVAIQIGNEVKAYRVTPSSDNLTATLSSDDPHYWAGESTVTVSAWWPYTDGQTSMPAVTVQADQRGDGYAQSDHIGVAEELLHYNGGTPTLAFTHRTARVTVVLTDYTEGLKSVQLTGLSTENGNPAEITPYDKSGDTYTALVAPQSVAAGTTFITCKFTNGKVFVYKMKNDTDWQAGEEYTYTVSLAAAKDPGYTVSEDGKTYNVTSADGLKNVAELVNGGKTDINITLDTDLTLTGEWTPIGTESQPYTGTFNGKDKTITGLTVNQEGTNYVGLIGYLGSGGKVQNVTLTDVSVTGYWYVGGVVGANDKGTVTACTASGSISGSSRVGGVVEYNGGTMTGCTVSGSVSGDSSVGGVVGWNGGTVTACYWSGLPDNDNGGATKVDGTNVTWQTAVAAMNAALQNAGSEWRYELTGALPTLKKQ
ncbi:fimbrillin family protein [Phocaeicola plebeius]|uniref:fimbrillin family protein n=1 Tax=Phocaeicola plebeius TaxID=310297 RepID=UPI00195D0955|nr:fimbrillin family protein [Phocaeicola plebeius]MBM6963070.1 fimbrillin family protein [Phocaeicola plebeius]